MGQYGGTKLQFQGVDVGEDSTVYDLFKTHASGKRIHTELAIFEAIRAARPDCHATCIATRYCDLIGFSKAGFATAALKTDGSEYVTQRLYEAPATRLEGGFGSLGESVTFGCYDCTFKEKKYQFYVAQWKELFDRFNFTYVLSPKSNADAAGHDSSVDDLILVASKWTNDPHDEIYVFDDGDWEKNKKLWAAVQNSHWDDVILDPAMKATLIDDVHNFFDNRSLYEEYAVPWKRGIIFHGTPGCGKTISIKALMNTLDKRETPVASLYVKTLQNCRGMHYAVREIFTQARKMAPCLLVFEDLDSLVADKVRSYFLNEVDGLEDNDGILMIGSTNHLDRLDPGISKRPSRFDRKYHYKIPGKEERILYCEYWKKKLEKNKNIDFDPAICEVVAKLTEGFSFAYLKELFVQTLLTIVGGRATDVEEADVEDAAENTSLIPGSTKLAVPGENVSSNSEDNKSKDKDEKEVAVSANAQKREMPEVDIPEHIASNPLMKVLQKQAKALWRDFDTMDEEVLAKKTPKKGMDTMEAVPADDDDEEDD